jgi:hypothetical protein
MPRSAAEATLDLLALCAYEEPLVPFSLKVAEEDAATLLRVSFADDAVLDLALADRHNGVDSADRWRKAQAEVEATLDPYPTGEA